MSDGQNTKKYDFDSIGESVEVILSAIASSRPYFTLDANWDLVMDEGE